MSESAAVGDLPKDVSGIPVSLEKEEAERSLRLYSGQCHCGAVQFKVLAPQHLVAWNCNCSICTMKKNFHFVVPQQDFKLLPTCSTERRIDAGAALDADASGTATAAAATAGPRGLGIELATSQPPVHVREKFNSYETVSERDHGHITTYTFGSHTAKHTFCSVCGVQSFYHPRSNPDGVAVTLDCLIPRVPLIDASATGTSASEHCSSELRHFDGQRWEAFIEASGIRAFSKVI
jgi:hypothetical protein